MEISKSLFAEILAVQQKLHSAILEHQTSVEKLKNDPNNQSILGQIKKIQVHIVTLGKCQNQIVQRLRKEVESKADNANGSKISIPSLLGLNNNNHITNNNETKHEAATNGFETKEDYEEVVRNGDVHGSQDNDCAKLRPSSVETVSGEDEDIVEVSLDENSDDKQEVQKEEDIESPEKYDYLYRLGLITKSKCIELQNRRVERKRRSTANPQFVYSLFEQPSKRKRYSYLQSGNAPHTRQTTARINGPSPPPSKTQSTKSTSPPAQTITKSLIPVQKSTTRPNILRNADSKVFVNKNKTEDNQMQLSIPSAKSVQSMNNKAVHIPGLPSSLTIERIGSDSIVCICCENPGSLTTCKNCSSNYHISCHIRSSPPSRICPKCTLAMDEEEDTEKDEVGEIKEEMEDDNKLLRYKKDEKFATTANASGFTGKARENSEIYKAPSGLYKIDPAQKKHIFSTVFGINQLPASTFLIPITANNVSASNVSQSEDKLASVFDTEYRQNIIHRNHHIVSHHSRPNITYIQEEVSHSYQLPSTTSIQPEKHQSYFIIKKITESIGRSNQSPSSETEDEYRSTTNIFNHQLPTSSCSATIQSGLHPVITYSLFHDRNNRKKQTNRAVSLQPISKLSNSLYSISNDYQLDRATFNGKKPWAKLTRGKLCINQSTRPTEILLSSCDDVENNGNEQQRPRSTGSAEEAAAANLDGYSKHRSRNFIHSLFPGHNKSNTITSCARESRGVRANDRDCPLLRQQLCREEHELELREQPEGKPTAAVQLQRHALTRFFEHVKLEEAHISAPLRTKLAHKDEVDDDDDDEVAREDEQYDDGRTVAEAPLLTACDVDDDRMVIRVPWLTDDSENACDGDNIASKAPVRRVSDAASTQSGNYIGYELVRVDSRSSAETRRHSAEREDDQSMTTTTTATAAALRIAQSNLSELRNEVSVPDDKADTEKQDLPSGGRLRSRSNSSSSSSSGHSDTPEQAMNVNDLTNDFNMLTKMGLVSPEERDEELEQVGDESASEADAATG
ncbi:uncharacterized protein LOC105835336 isoform X1 [Monomorium pharaonis]|uniref:uncharacterized protein LOC105835336 isoform X1 n=1 Tax=Monomorium pharaonis TaxID=307658 RepID=UPI00063F1C10|nr:uncharacterized protein LOC105835336 isoform X1 [Monomorium pharaonis]